MSADSPGSEGDRVALFPLNVVLFPGGLLPLRIFEPRYLRMVSECLRNQRPFVVAAIVEGREVGDTPLTARIGTLAWIVDWEQQPDGLLGLLCEGGQRVMLGDTHVEHDGLLRTGATLLDAEPAEPLPDDLAWMAALLKELLGRVGAPYDRLRVAQPSADHVVNRLVELLPLPLAEKQALFEIAGGAQRLRRLAGLINPQGAEAPLS